MKLASGLVLLLLIVACTRPQSKEVAEVESSPNPDQTSLETITRSTSPLGTNLTGIADWTG